MGSDDDRDDPFGLSVFAFACLIGTLAGWLLLGTIFSITQGTLLLGPSALVGIFVAVPPTFIFVFCGLLLFGLPLLYLLYRHLATGWVGVVATGLGIICGTLFMLLLSALVGTPSLPSAVTFGSSFGGPTALAWWYLMRRKILRASR